MNIRRDQAVLFLLFVFAVAIILSPMMESMACDEPEKGFVEQMLVEMGFVTDTKICPAFGAVALEILANLVCMAVGVFTGFRFGKFREKPEVYTWHGWIPPDDAMLRAQVREGGFGQRPYQDIF